MSNRKQTPGEFAQAVREPDVKIIRRLIKLGLDRKAWTMKELTKVLGVSFTTVWGWTVQEDKGSWTFIDSQQRELLLSLASQTKSLNPTQRDQLRELVERL